MQTRHTFLVGLLSLIATVGLVGLLMLFGELDGLFKPGYAVNIHTDNAGGARRGSAVTLNGVAIGRIDAIDLEGAGDHPVRLVAVIEQGVDIPGDAAFAMEQPLIGGSSTIAIITAGAVGPTLATDGSAILTGRYTSMLEQLSTAFDSRIEPLMETMTAFRETALTFTEFGEGLNEFIGPQREGAAPTLSTVVTNLNSILVEIDETMQWITEEQLKDDVRDAVAGANEFFTEASTAAQEYGALARSLDQETQAFLRRIGPVADELGRTLEEVRMLANIARTGDGTLGLMLNDPDLYKSLSDAAARLERTLVQIQLFVEKAKAEGLPVSF